MRPNGELPSDPQQKTATVRRAKAPVAVHHRSACSGVKALRNTSPARRQAAKLCYRFGPLTPSARSANLIAGDGTWRNRRGRLRTRRAGNLCGVKRHPEEPMDQQCHYVGLDVSLETTS